MRITPPHRRCGNNSATSPPACSPRDCWRSPTSSKVTPACSLSPPNFPAALAAFERVAAITRATGDVEFQATALRGLALVSTGLGAPDALARCYDALDALFEIRLWQRIWQVLESVTLALATAGRLEPAAVIIGHLDAHTPGFGLEHAFHFRDRARELVEADGGHTAAQLRGASMSADELVANALAYCSANEPTDWARAR